MPSSIIIIYHAATVDAWTQARGGLCNNFTHLLRFGVQNNFTHFLRFETGGLVRRTTSRV